MRFNCHLGEICSKIKYLKLPNELEYFVLQFPLKMMSGLKRWFVKHPASWFSRDLYTRSYQDEFRL